MFAGQVPVLSVVVGRAYYILGLLWGLPFVATFGMFTRAFRNVKRGLTPIEYVL